MQTQTAREVAAAQQRVSEATRNVAVARWLWHNVLGPVFRGIGKVISWWWNNIVKRYFNTVKAAIRT
ncbi:hypothetical protein KBZ21_40610, partial [Streptomyces sp. A73]|nr:hypothetical protein [Streptomyces sp. A73]